MGDSDDGSHRPLASQHVLPSLRCSASLLPPFPLTLFFPVPFELTASHASNWHHKHPLSPTAAPAQPGQRLGVQVGTPSLGRIDLLGTKYKQ